jgi:dihydrofolate reductase
MNVGSGRRSTDVRIAWSAHAILHYLNAGLVDEFSIALVAAFLGSGIRLFDGIDNRRVSMDRLSALDSPMVTHLRYGVRSRGMAAPQD